MLKSTLSLIFCWILFDGKKTPLLLICKTSEWLISPGTTVGFCSSLTLEVESVNAVLWFGIETELDKGRSVTSGWVTLELSDVMQLFGFDKNVGEAVDIDVETEHNESFLIPNSKPVIGVVLLLAVKGLDVLMSLCFRIPDVNGRTFGRFSEVVVVAEETISTEVWLKAGGFIPVENENLVDTSLLTFRLLKMHELAWLSFDETETNNGDASCSGKFSLWELVIRSLFTDCWEILSGGVIGS